MLKKKIIRPIFCIIVFLIALIIFSIAVSFVLTVKKYEVKSGKITDSIRVVQLSDLHSYEHGKNNSRLIAKVKNENPDLILMTGDMMNDFDGNTDVAVNLIEKLKDTAPVYFSYGNHETSFEEKYNFDISKIMTDAGAVVLKDEFIDIELNGQKLRIGGFGGYCLPPKYGSDRPYDTAFMEKFVDTDDYKILLCHIPLCWFKSSSLDDWDVDIVYSGHFHGGVVKLPFIGGVFASEIGIFPGKVDGLFYSEDNESVLVISSGLGWHTFPRMNNPFQVVVTDIIPK